VSICWIVDVRRNEQHRKEDTTWDDERLYEWTWCDENCLAGMRATLFSETNKGGEENMSCLALPHSTTYTYTAVRTVELLLI
jgi:hypothetical protein